MNVPPTILSWSLIPLGLLWLISGVIHGIHYRGDFFESVPGFWLAMFYVGASIVVPTAGILISIRRRERTRFARVDKVALTIAALGAILFAVTIVIMLLELQRLNRRTGASSERAYSFLL